MALLVNNLLIINKFEIRHQLNFIQIQIQIQEQKQHWVMK